MAVRNTFDHSTGHLVSCGDAKIYVEETGDPGSPVLIMLHGGFGSMEDFHKITPALSRQFRLIGVDSRGHGKSSLGTAGLSYKMLTDDLAHVIDSLELQEFSILGFSDGGITAYRYAARQDARLRKVVTVGAHGEISEDDPAWQLLSAMTGEIWKEKFPASYELYMRLNPMPDFDHFAEAVVAMWTDLSPDGNPGALIKQIDNEMLIVRGDNDRLASLGSMTKLLKSVKNAHFLNIPFANHAAFDDAPEVFLRAFGTFFGVTLDMQPK
jgi:pimeloyl-ACP methyl ester carboxylesterase